MFFLLIFSTTILSAIKITLVDIEEHRITEKKTFYKITANSKNINLKKLKKFRFYNKEKLISDSSYYLEGRFLTLDLDIKFEKAYFLEGRFIMIDVEGSYLTDTTFKAKKSIYDRKSLILKNVFISVGKRKYKKYNYKLDLKE
jgi:hypothetical protein